MPCLLFGLFLPLAGYLRAQEDAFDPALFFPDTVEVIAAEPFQIPVATYEVRWDDARRQVTVLLPDGDATYPYPDDVVSFSRQQSPLWQNRVVLMGYGEAGPESSESFVLNLLKGNITPYESQCGEDRPPGLFIELYDALWVLEETPAGYVLCAALTGERTPPLALPGDFRPLDSAGRYNSLSPDFSRVLFLGDKGEVYTYTFADQQVTLIGTLAGDQWYLQSFGWMDNELFTLTFSSHDLCSRYLIDVTRTSALQPVMQASDECPQLLRDTPGYLVVRRYQPVSQDSPFFTCTRAYYDLNTREWQDYEYGTLCQPDYGSYTADGYYRAVSDDLTRADVVRFNPQTGERETLYEGGAVEWVRWVSADERFAVLVLDNNGQIDRIPGTYADSWYGITEPSLVFVELASGTIRYALPVEWQPDYSNDILSDITMVREDLLLVEIRELDITPSLGDSWIQSARHVQSQLVQLSGGDPIITNIGSVQEVLPGQARLLVSADAGDTAFSLYVYDLATGQSTPVLRRTEFTRYWVNVAATDQPDTALVTVNPVVDGVVDSRQGVRYTIRF